MDLVLDKADFCTKDGGFSKPCIADLNNDSYLDLITGNKSGGLAYFKGVEPNKVKTIPRQSISFKRFKGQLQFKNPYIQSIKIFDIHGRLIENSQSECIHIPPLRGTYLILVELKNQLIPTKFVK